MPRVHGRTREGFESALASLRRHFADGQLNITVSDSGWSIEHPLRHAIPINPPTALRDEIEDLYHGKDGQS